MATQIQGSGQTWQAPIRGPGPVDAQTLAQGLIERHRTAAGMDFPALRRELDTIGVRDSALGREVTAAVERRLTPVQRGEFARATYVVAGANGAGVTIGAGAPSVADYRAMPPGSVGRAEYDRLDRAFGDGDLATDDTLMIDEAIRRGIAGRSAPTPAAAPQPATDTVRLGLDLTQMGLDLAGIVDPSGIADGSNAVISGGRAVGALLSGQASEAGGHLVNGGISLLGIAVGVGDLAKIGKVGEWARTVTDATRAVADNPALRSALEPGLREIHRLVRSIPQGALDAMPTAARESIERMKVQLDDLFGTGARGADATTGYTATVRGQEVVLRGVDTVPVNYVKRDRGELATLRSQFNGVRADFARDLASDPSKVDALRRAGLDDSAIQRLASGRVPEGWQVHHKLPLDDGGTNAFENLVLIKNDPYHIAITNAQTILVGDLAVGASRQVDFPVPPGFVYPSRP